MSAMPRPARNRDLHGNAPDEARLALVLIDVINDLDFPGGAALQRPALAMARRLAALKGRARKLDIPAIYVNDNFGRWRSDFATLVAHCRRPGGFFATPLDTLLLYLGVETLILTGLTTDRCVLFTAADAHMRDYHLFVPRDCVAAIDAAVHRQALRHLERVLGVSTMPSADLDLPALLGRRRASAKNSTTESGRRRVA